MKHLDDIELEITALKAYIHCQENGNDLYYSSPQYQKNLFRLQALESERDVLRGKVSPLPISFEAESNAKRRILRHLARSRGSWYAAYHQNLSLSDLQIIDPKPTIRVQKVRDFPKSTRGHDTSISAEE